MQSININSPNSLADWLRSSIEALDYQLWGIELARQRGNRLIRIFIDKAEGIRIDDCALVSQQVEALLEANNLYADAYLLEVSSPGLERSFFYCQQLENYLGRTLKVRSKALINGRRRLLGELTQVDQNHFFLRLEEETLKLNFDQAESIKLTL